MVDLAPILLWLSFGIQYLYLLDHFLISVANLFVVIMCTSTCGQLKRRDLV